MTSLRYLIAAGLAASLLAGPAAAGDVADLPSLGYSTTDSTLGGCRYWSASGFGVSVSFGSDCAPGFQAAVDAFIAGHPERKLGFQHPAAVTARSTVEAKGYAVSTNYAGPSFNVTGGCDVNSTVDAAGLVALAGSLPAAAPCPPPPPTTTEPPPETTTPTTTTEPTTTTAPPPAEPPPPTSLEDLQAQIDALQAALAALAARVNGIQMANVAAWDAWVEATAAGLPPDEVALAARSAGMNALYGL